MRRIIDFLALAIGASLAIPCVIIFTLWLIERT